MEEKKKQETAKKPVNDKKETESANQIFEFLKNPLVTAIAGFMAGKLLTESAYKDEINKLKEKFDELSRKGKEEFPQTKEPEQNLIRQKSKGKSEGFMYLD